jgi:hypothetical protein
MSAVDRHLADEDRDKHAHRLDLTPCMVNGDPWRLEQPERLYAELVDVYGQAAARLLWELATEFDEDAAA